MGAGRDDPFQEARLLGEALAHALNLSLVGVLLWLPSVVALALMMRRHRELGG
jgi:hypothetical protein